jgi:hypothetical protein
MARTFTRQELYDLVWTDPISVVAKPLGVSDVWLRKNCVAANIPVPERGYWARKKAGQTPRRVPLPERGLGEADEISIGREALAWYPQDAEVGDAPPLKIFSESLDEIRKRATSLAGRVTASRSLDKPHSSIAKLLEEDERRRTKLLETPYAWEKPRFDGPDDRRRLRIINGLFLGLSRAGAVPGVRGKDPIEWAVRVGDTSVSITLEPVGQKGAARRQHGQQGRKEPTRLKLTLDDLSEYPDLVCSWEDQDDKTLEQQIGEIAIAVLVTGEMAYRAWVIRRHRWHVERRVEYLEKLRLQKEKEERQRREEILRVAAERRKRLISDANAWRLAADIRAFTAAVRELHAEHSDSAAEMSLREWLAWAIAEADGIDPLTRQLAQLVDYAPTEDLTVGQKGHAV